MKLRMDPHLQIDMKFLGVDHGTVRIGLAVSDEMGMIATPLAVFRSKSTEDGIGYIISQAEVHDVGMIVVGMPLQLDGSPGQAADAVRKFADRLAGRTEIPIDFWDERMTTAQAERSMISADMTRKSRKKRIDAVAAQMMLQSYLDARRLSRKATTDER